MTIMLSHSATTAICFWLIGPKGRILAVKLRPNGAGHQAQAEVFLQGQPLNVTDLAVAKDGSIYFCTGGRARPVAFIECIGKVRSLLR